MGALSVCFAKNMWIVYKVQLMLCTNYEQPKTIDFYLYIETKKTPKEKLKIKRAKKPLSLLVQSEADTFSVSRF